MKKCVIQSLVEAQIEAWKILPDNELERIYNKEKNFGHAANVRLLKEIMDKRGINSFED